MLVVTAIQFVEIDDHGDQMCDIDHWPMRPTEVMSSDDACFPIDELPTIKREHVYGRRFINAKGYEVCIGMSQNAQTALGLPFGVFDDQEQELIGLRTELIKSYDSRESLLCDIEQLKQTVSGLVCELFKIKSRSLWDEISFRVDLYITKHRKALGAKE